jgi:hypothetical protein
MDLSIGFGNALTLAQFAIMVLMIIWYYLIKRDYKFPFTTTIINRMALALPGQFMNPGLAVEKRNKLASLILNIELLSFYNMFIRPPYGCLEL